MSFEYHAMGAVVRRLHLKWISLSARKVSCLSRAIFRPNVSPCIIKIFVERPKPSNKVQEGVACHSKIPWYPKLLFRRENALASFWVQRILVTQPRPSQVMIKHDFLLWGILELKLNPRCWIYVEIPKPSRVSLKLLFSSTLKGFGIST
jgi:hypothetical protein